MQSKVGRQISLVLLSISPNFGAVAQNGLELGPFSGEILRNKISISYSAKFLIEKISLNKTANVSARAIFDLPDMSSKMRDLILSEIKKDNLIIGGESFGFTIDPSKIMLVAINGKPIIAVTLSLNNAKFLGKNVNDEFKNAAEISIPLRLKFSSGSGVALSTERPAVALRGEFKELVDAFDFIPGIDLPKMIAEKIIETVAWKQSFRLQEADPYKIKLLSYKVCHFEGRLLLDAAGTAVISPDMLNPLLSSFLYKPEKPSMVRVRLPNN